MKVTFLVQDINCPVLGPVTVLAGHLAGRFDVEIVGPDFGHGVCPMYRQSFPYRVVQTPRLYRFPDYFWEAGKVARSVTGDVVVAVKAFADTVPVALWEKFRRQRKIIVYLDEWDGALYGQLSPSEKRSRWLGHWQHPMDDVYCPFVERLIPRADLVLSTSTFLQKKFGGQVLHMGVDTDFFKPPSPQESAQLRHALGLDGYKLIVFGGVVRPHKGIEVLLDALALLKDKTIQLLVVGPETEHLKLLMNDARYQPYVRWAGVQPKARMPAYLALADLIVLPQNDTLLARSQVPCKIFEAMAVARPIIASAVSDLPAILDGCGWTVPPGDAKTLAAAIRDVLDQPERAAARGQLARDKCLRLYSKKQTALQLYEAIMHLGS